MKQADQFEYTAFIALFKATMEQTAQLNGTTKQQTKVIFKRFQNDGLRLLKHIEAVAKIEQLEDVTAIIEDSIHEMRKQLVQKIPD